MVRPTLSNPKSNAEYLDMLNSYYKLYVQADKKWKETLAYAKTLDLEKWGEYQTHEDLLREFVKMARRDFTWASLDETTVSREEYLGWIVDKAVTEYKRNDRIEAILKYDRADLAGDLLHVIRALKMRADNLEGEGYETLAHLMSLLQKELATLEPSLKKLISDYFMKNQGDQYQEERKARGTYSWESMPMENLKHFMDLYETNRQLYRALNDYSWANKTLHKIFTDLSAIETSLATRITRDMKKYTEAWEHMSETEEFMKITKDMSWYIIYENSCYFEAYLGSGKEGSHCGTDEAADFLLSLRTLDEHNMYDSHVTISVKEWEIPAQSKHAKLKKVWEVLQVKGKGNSVVKPEYWKAIMLLFLRPEFGWQGKGSYRPERDFRPYWIEQMHSEKLISDELFDELEPLRVKLFNNKQWWEEKSMAIREYGVLYLELIQHMTRQMPKGVISVNEGGDIEVTYDDIYTMLEDIKDWDDKFEEVLKVNEDFVELYDRCYMEYDYEDFESILKKKFPKVYKALEATAKELDEDVKYVLTKEPVSDEAEAFVKAMELATLRGWEVGTQDAKWEAYVKHLDGLELKNSDSTHYATIEKLTEGRTLESGFFVPRWQITFFFTELMEYFEVNGEPGFYYPKFNQGFRRYGDYTDWNFEWEGDFSLEAAQEDFPEQMYQSGLDNEILGIKKGK